MDNSKDKKPKERSMCEVRVDCMVPATVTYRVLAEDPEHALILIKNRAPDKIAYKVARRKQLKLYVYEAGTCILKFIKNLV